MIGTYKKKVTRAAVIICFISLALSGHPVVTAETTSNGVLTYSISGENVSVESCLRTARQEEVMEALEEIEGQGFTITAIGDNAFEDCKNITSFDLPDGLLTIGKRAFAGSGIVSVTIPKTVTTIGGNSTTLAAFNGASQLTEVTFAEGRKSIPDYALAEAQNIRQISLPMGLESIGLYAFYNCKSMTSFDLPNGLTSIGEHAFESCESLGSITLSEGLSKIGDYAFENCGNLDGIDLPDGLTSIGKRAFAKSGLHKISIPKTVTVMGGSTPTLSAFNGANQLTEVVFREGMKTIPPYALAEAQYVTQVDIPDSVELIEVYAFYNCKQMSVIELPNALNTIGDYAFEGCEALKEIELPYGLNSIGRRAFAKVAGLEKLFIPKSVMTFGLDWLLGCESTKVYSFCGSPVIEYATANQLTQTILATIITESLEPSMNHIPYSQFLMVENPDGLNVKYDSEGLEGSGLILNEDTGEIYGVPIFEGLLTFTVKVISFEDSSELPMWDEITFTLGIELPTNDKLLKEFGGINDYDVLIPIGGENYTLEVFEDEVTDVVFKTGGEFKYFEDFYIDGVKQERGVAYLADEGSTVITLLAKTVKGLGNASHTVVSEYRDENNVMTKAAQNFTLNRKAKPASSPKPSETNKPNATPKPSETNKPNATPKPSETTVPVGSVKTDGTAQSGDSSNSNGTKQSSNTTQSSSSSLRLALAKPKKLKLTASKATWKAVANNNGYTLTIYRNAKKKPLRTIQIKKGKTSYKFTKAVRKKLKKGKTYKFTLLAKGKGGFKNSKITSKKYTIAR